MFIVQNNSALAAYCDGKPEALGVSRVIAVDPLEHPLIGSMQYSETLPLKNREVVLTFDDGPSPRYTDRILAILTAECVKATFFMVGEMAKTFPAEAQKVAAAGHTIGTHSFRHPFTFGRMTEGQAGEEIDEGIRAVGSALGDPAAIAPFFRVPGFLTSKSTEAAIASRGLMTWSADVPADDWKKISSSEITRRAISRIEAKGRGILLLHDIHEHTVAALPNILKELKQKGYKVVQVVPADSTVAKTQTTPEQWRMPPVQMAKASRDGGGADAAARAGSAAPVTAALNESGKRLGGLAARSDVRRRSKHAAAWKFNKLQRRYVSYRTASRRRRQAALSGMHTERQRPRITATHGRRKAAT